MRGPVFRKVSPLVRAVLFDLDGTLYDRDATVRAIADRQYSKYERALEGVPRSVFLARVVELDDHGHGEKSDLYDTLVREWNLPRTLGRSMLDDFWNHYHSNCRIYPEVVPTFEEIRRRGMKIGLVTNGRHAIQEATVEALGIRQLLDQILISESEGVRKPDPEIFIRVASRFELRTAECCFVGDHPEADVAGAVATGMTAIWMRVPYWREPVEALATVETVEQALVHLPGGMA